MPCSSIRLRTCIKLPHGRSASSVASSGMQPGLGRDETPEEALERRVRETKRVEERVTHIHSLSEWERELRAAKRNLVVVEIQGESVCQMSLEDTAEYHWKDEKRMAQEEAMLTCGEIKHTFQRIARDCTDATFLSVMVDDEDPPPEVSALCDHLGIEVLPTLQFWRGGSKLWEHKGALHMGADLAEGVLFYDGSMANGVQAADFVQELHTKEDLDAFISSGDDRVLKVVNMALTTAAPCIRVYPAVLALAKNFVGFASFARVIGDQTPQTVQILRDFGVIEVPTFVFFR